MQFSNFTLKIGMNKGCPQGKQTPLAVCHVGNSTCYRTGQRDPRQGSSSVETPCLRQGDSLSDWICAANKKSNGGTGTVQDLFNGQRMEKREPIGRTKLPIPVWAETPDIQEGPCKGEGIGVRGLLTYLRTGVWFDATLLFSPCIDFSGCYHGSCVI